jgi:hypothetical protein
MRGQNIDICACVVFHSSGSLLFIGFIRHALRNSEFIASSGTKLVLTFKGKYVDGDGRGRISGTNPRYLRQKLSNNTKIYRYRHSLDRD